MRPENQRAFERNSAEACEASVVDKAPMIRAQMNGSDWLIMLVLAVIWGGAFFFIGVAVRHVPPMTYVWLRVTIAAVALWIFVKARGGSLDLPRQVWGSIVLLAVLNNARPFTLFGW
jgi:drug/metabolite transporter (DMT)-like permease